MEDLFEQITGQRKTRTRRRGINSEARLEARALEDALGGYSGGRDYGFESGSTLNSGWLDLDHELASEKTFGEKSFGGNRKGDFELEEDEGSRGRFALEDEE